MIDTFRLPMFPLGSVLFPGAVMPLQVFEPRYLQMFADLGAGDGRFGVVLIERGWEVGGGDQRFDTATTARVVRVAKMDETRLAVVAVGEDRVHVTQWLPDDPYPAAMVEPLDDGPGEDTTETLASAQAALRRTLAFASELGYDIGDVEGQIPDEPEPAAWYLCAVSPLEEMDRYRLLALPGARSRLEALVVLLGERSITLQAQLGGA